MKADPRGVLTGDHFIDGDHAACEGALAAGCRFVAGYPITPSTPMAENVDEWAAKGKKNLFDQPVEEILASPRAAAIREGFSRRSPAEELCRRCGYAARF